MASPIKILIIEDRRENIVFLANNVFKPRGYEVITAMDGKTGLRKALEEQPDLILTDLNLPGMNGLDLLADLKERGANIPTIVMTLQGSEETAIKAFRLGAENYLIKPFSIDDIENTLDRVLRKLKSPAAATADKKTQQYVAELEAKVARQETLLATHQPEPPAAPPNDKPEATKKLQALVKQQHAEIARLTQQLQQQKDLTAEARNHARSIMQFIQGQQRDIALQQAEAVQLTRQLAALSKIVTRLTARIESQARQFKVSGS